MPALDYLFDRIWSQIWHTVYQREDYGFYKSASREVEDAVLFVPWCLIFSAIGCHTVGVRKKNTIPSLGGLSWKN